MIAHKHLFGLCEKFDGFESLAGATGCDGGKGERFRGFVAEAEVEKGLVGGATEVTSVSVQVEFEIDFR